MKGAHLDWGGAFPLSQSHHGVDAPLVGAIDKR